MEYYRIEYKNGNCHYIFSWNVPGDEVEKTRKHCIKSNNDDNLDHALVFYQGTQTV